MMRWLAIPLLLVSFAASAQIIFFDDFEAQDPNWNIGDGPLDTPPGSQGYWDNWDTGQCSNICSDCSGRPSHAGNYLMWMEPTGGVDGGQGIKTGVKNGCNVKQYPATLAYRAASPKPTEFCYAFHARWEAWSITGAQNTKWHARWHIDDRGEFNNGTNFYFNIEQPSFTGGTYLRAYGQSFNNGEHWPLNITQDEFYDDQGWHWFAICAKLNSHSSLKDGELYVYLDEVLQRSATGESFYNATPPSLVGSWGLNDIWLHWHGNSTDGDFDQTDWRGPILDNFTFSLGLTPPPDPRVDPPDLPDLDAPVAVELNLAPQ